VGELRSASDWQYVQQYVAGRHDSPMADRSPCERAQMDPNLDGRVDLQVR
jgi:hypothetical protein